MIVSCENLLLVASHKKSWVMQGCMMQEWASLLEIKLTGVQNSYESYHRLELLCMYVGKLIYIHVNT